MKKFQPIYCAALLGAFALCGCGALSDQANDQQDPSQSAPPASAPASTPASAPTNPLLSGVPSTTVANGKNVPLVNMPSGVRYYDIKVGSGAVAKDGDKVSMLYTGKLMDGSTFDATSRHGNTPFPFTIGGGQVIKGWDLGVPGMKVGGERLLVIPSELGYGANPPQGAPIPPNATLIFDVTLKAIG
jgi:peptidylprolyl isomerase